MLRRGNEDVNEDDECCARFERYVEYILSVCNVCGLG
jgi:hypothetical protein